MTLDEALKEIEQLKEKLDSLLVELAQLRQQGGRTEMSNPLQDRIELMIDLVIERTADTVLTEAVDGIHKGQFILWSADGSRVIRVGTKDFAKSGASLSAPSPRQG